jgi:predicted anti-sigma-YlaC factor YlaD
MPCAGFEGRLIDYSESSGEERRILDAHLAACPSCREYFDALESLDRALTVSYSGVAAPDSLASRVRARAKSPSRIPELLDGVGWLGISALIAAIAWHERVTEDMTPWAFAAVGVLLIAGFWVSLRSLGKSESY